MKLKGNINLSVFDPNKKEVKDFIEEKNLRKTMGSNNLLD